MKGTRANYTDTDNVRWYNDSDYFHQIVNCDSTNMLSLYYVKTHERNRVVTAVNGMYGVLCVDSDRKEKNGN